METQYIDKVSKEKMEQISKDKTKEELEKLNQLLQNNPNLLKKKR